MEVICVCGCVPGGGGGQADFKFALISTKNANKRQAIFRARRECQKIRETSQNITHVAGKTSRRLSRNFEQV